MKSDKSKLREGRCIGEGKDYVGYIKANEQSSIGTSGIIYDPIAGRTVHVLSMGEREFFYTMRLNDEVISIEEQMMMSSDLVREICIKHGYRIPNHILSIDFLITFTDGSRKAYSVKADRSELDKNSRKYRNAPLAYQKAMIRHHIEQEYWRMQGVDFKFVFRSELNKAFAYNVQQVLMFYDERSVTCEAHMYMWLVAHKIIKIDLSDSIICFPKLVCGMEDKVRDLFERSVAYGYQS